MWKASLADTLQIPLINADRMMLSILPEPGSDGLLPDWAATLRDHDRGWMGVAQQGVLAFVGQAMGAKVPFAMETVFSDWEPQDDGSIRSKIQLIQQLQASGYFVLLLFVGLASPELSVMRVATRVAEGGHGVEEATMRRRFPRTQRAISEAIKIANASVLTDNSRDKRQAFSVCRVQLGEVVLFDVRESRSPPPAIISAWMDKVAPTE
jgi:predicted ABC-type ATPase